MDRTDLCGSNFATLYCRLFGHQDFLNGRIGTLYSEWTFEVCFMSLWWKSDSIWEIWNKILWARQWNNLLRIPCNLSPPTSPQTKAQSSLGSAVKQSIMYPTCNLWILPSQGLNSSSLWHAQIQNINQIINTNWISIKIQEVSIGSMLSLAITYVHLFQRPKKHTYCIDLWSIAMVK